MAFVVLRPGASASAGDLVAWSREHMANYKAPRRVEIISELPLNATGKVLTNALRSRTAKSRRPTQDPDPGGRRMPIRAEQWTPGNVDKKAVRAQLAHPQQELVGCHAWRAE